MHIYQHTIKLHETDAAGILFFSHQFEIVHDAYETLLAKIGFGFAELLRHQDFFLPIVHAEADYKLPLFVGDVLEVRITVARVGRTSFTFAYQLFNVKKELVGTAQTVHVTIDKKSRRKIPLPPAMRARIQELYEQDS